MSLGVPDASTLEPRAPTVLGGAASRQCLVGPPCRLEAVLCLPLLAVPCQCPLVQANEVAIRTSPKPGECLGFHVHLT